MANEYRKAGDLEQAIDICRQHLAEQPSHMSGHIVFGQALFEAGQLDEAGQVFTAALALDPENLIALRHLGDIARGQGDARSAQGWYQRVLDADPRNEEIAALVRELGAQVPLEGFAGLPAAEDEPAPAEPEPERASAFEAPMPDDREADAARHALADAPTTEFIPPRWATPSAPLPFLEAEAPTPAPLDVTHASADAVPDSPAAPDDEVVTAEAPVFEPLDLPTSRASVVLPASALPPERVVEPLPNTLEIPQVDVQRLLEAARERVSEAAPVIDQSPPDDDAPLDVATGDDLEMPSADELRAPPAVEAVAGDPLADLPMEMLEGFGEASAESLLASGRAAPAPESPLANLEAEVGEVDEPLPLIGGGSAGTDAGLEFMENPLGDLATATPTPSSTASALDGFSFGPDTDALAPEPPLPPPVAPTFEPAEPDDPLAAPRTSAAMPRVSEPMPRIPTPVGAPAFMTEAMGELLEQQGHYGQAADVYRALLADRPGDARLAQHLARAEAQLAPSAWSAREWLQQLAAVRLPTPVSSAPVTPWAEPATAPSVPVDDAAVSASAARAPEPVLVAAGAGSLESLFGPPSSPADEAAAVALAALYDESAAIPGAPTAPAGDELSLKAVFEPPAAPAPRTSAAFSFDQFFAAVPKAATPAPGGGDAELAEFTRWLDGLKKQ
ncbi:MAG: tetratricopeptide repeat protein [Gemmatimonadaceae bacterium]|nr:tetratricopeptide repeat protein [Gemmatimonadaceae bacterium]